MTLLWRKFLPLLASLAVLAVGGSAVAQVSSDAAPAQGNGAAVSAPAAPETEADPLKRAVPDKIKKEQAKKLRQELGKTYKKWLDEDVRWIISDQERQAFLQLSNDEERDNFIDQFWARRNPMPDSPTNDFKEEHYRRIAYANEHYSAGVPGWRSDRGRMYIMYGPPDEINAHPTGGTYQQTQDEGGNTTTTYPYEVWRYRHLEGVGQEIEIEFVDNCMCGDYHMATDASEKNASSTSGSGVSTSNGISQVRNGYSSIQQGAKQFDRLETYSKLNQPPPVQFKDLEASVTHRVTVNLLPYDVRVDFVKVTSETVLVPVTIQVRNKDVTYASKDSVQQATINIFGRVTGLTGRVAQTFEDTIRIDTPADLFEKTVAQSSVYWKALPLRPGRYRMDLVLKDVNGDRIGTWSRGIVVPDLGDEKLAASSLILADQMEKVGARDIGVGNFVIGDTRVHPRVAPSDGRPASFQRSQRANFWMQVYNLEIDPQTHKPNATIEYDVVKLTQSATAGKPIVHAVETTAQMKSAGQQMTLAKSLSLSSLEPGTYEASIKVTDKVANKSLEPVPAVRFAVE